MERDFLQLLFPLIGSVMCSLREEWVIEQVGGGVSGFRVIEGKSNEA